jgi:uncharacterized protein YigE (DUF2233 family)
MTYQISALPDWPQIKTNCIMIYEKRRKLLICKDGAIHFLIGVVAVFFHFSFYLLKRDHTAVLALRSFN